MLGSALRWQASRPKILCSQDRGKRGLRNCGPISQACWQDISFPTRAYAVNALQSLCSGLAVPSNIHRPVPWLQTTFVGSRQVRLEIPAVLTVGHNKALVDWHQMEHLTELQCVALTLRLQVPTSSSTVRPSWSAGCSCWCKKSTDYRASCQFPSAQCCRRSQTAVIVAEEQQRHLRC